VWLLIVNDQFLGAGEVYARRDHLAQWKFAYGFEKVLLFSREPGGGGEVIEVQRADGLNLAENARLADVPDDAGPRYGKLRDSKPTEPIDTRQIGGLREQSQLHR
jgi:hypothetical protein